LTKICYEYDFEVTFGTSLGVGCDPDKVSRGGCGGSKTFTILEARVGFGT